MFTQSTHNGQCIPGRAVHTEPTSMPLRITCTPSWRSSLTTTGPAFELITSILGEGRARDNEVVWRVTQFGRPCLVYLHSWASGPQTVTTLDSARPAHSMVRHFDVRTLDDLEAIEEEMRSLLAPARA
jgi:hypothetical protein